MAQVLGLMDVTIDGVTVPCGAKSTIDVGGMSRKVVKSNNKVFYQEELQESKIELDSLIDSDWSADYWRGIKNSTIVCTCDTGQVWTVAGGFVTLPPVADQSGGTAKIIINGPPATEILGAVS